MSNDFLARDAETQYKQCESEFCLRYNFSCIIRKLDVVARAPPRPVHSQCASHLTHTPAALFIQRWEQEDTDHSIIGRRACS